MYFKHLINNNGGHPTRSVYQLSEVALVFGRDQQFFFHAIDSAKFSRRLSSSALARSTNP